MNKNLKKIIRFYLYSAIAFSATKALCSEIKTHNSKNAKKIPLFNFKSMNTEKKYNNIVLTLPQEENTEVKIQCDKCNETADGLIPNAYEDILNHKKSLLLFNFISMNNQENYDDIISTLPQREKTHIKIQCDKCNETTDGLIPDAYKIIFAHRKLHQSKKDSEILDSKNNVSNEDNPEIHLPKKRKIPITDFLNPKTNASKPNKIQKIETSSSIKYVGEYAILKFSLIDTPQKYNNIAHEIGGKSTLTIIKCSYPQCNIQTSGIFYSARSNMHKHIKRIHGITPSKNELRKKLVLEPKNETNYIELSFSSIATQKQYDNWAFTQDNRKTTKVIINCMLCDSQRTGPMSKARSRMLIHIEEKHFICRCGKQYESIAQIEDCKKHH